MELVIKTAAEVIALGADGRQVARRAARETDLMRHVLQVFVERTDPVPVQWIAAAFPGQPPEKVFEALAKLDEDDLIRIRDGRVDLAYPSSVSPTPFVLELSRERGERYACCAVDALGLAPMLGQPVRIRSRCHHCPLPLKLSVDPSVLGPDAEGVMVWVETRAEDERRACDSH